MADPLTHSEPSDGGDARAEANSVGDERETGKPRSNQGLDTTPFSGSIVGIGASAGGLEAFSELLKNLPINTGMAFVLVQHLDPRHSSILAELLGSLTRMPVIQVHGETPVEPDHVYVIPPNATMVIANRILKLNPPAQDSSRQRRPIDAFLTSLADDAHNRAIGVVLSGALSDGTLGLKAIKAEGGITFAQDGTAKFEDMPQSAISAGVVDFILSPQRIAHELAAIARHPLPAETPENVLEDGPTLGKALRLLRKRSGVDFAQYKQATIQRRLARRMLVHKAETLEEYFELLQREPSEVEALFDDLLIKVTEFFRDAAVFDVLKQVAFPAMVKDRAQGDVLRIWVPGCSSGEEVYSIAIALLEYLEGERLSLSVQLFGTDVSERVIGKARAGIFHDSGITTLSPERLRRFFVETDAGYQIGREVRDLCIFSCHNLGNDPPLSRMDLISCRNLLIYFAPALQHRVIDRLAYALRPTGCLLLGSSESTGRLTELFDALDEERKIYRRNPTVPARAAESITSLVSEPHISAESPELFEPDVAKGAVHTLVDRMLLSRYGPSGIVVNKDLRIVEFRGEVDRFVRITTDTPSVELLDVVREDLAVHLRAAIDEAHERKTTVRLDEIQVRRDRAFHFVRITIIPVAVPSSGAHTVILFEDLADMTSHPLKRAATVSPSAGAEVGVLENPVRHIEHLEHELAASRAYLQSIIEELRSTNEEAQSVNEELQSTNEELQTTKEELQASNEELHTINAEMKSRNVQLGQSNDDLTNLLSSINTPIIMVDNDLRIRRFTPAAEKVLHLIPVDVGRPISDIKTRINVPDLDAILTSVLDSLAGHEQEVLDSEGRGYLMRVRPYRSAANRIEGAVLILIDISDLKSSEARYRQLFESAHDGIIIVDVVTGEIADLNPHTEQLLGYSREEMTGQKLWETNALRGNPGIRAAVEQIRDQGVVRFAEVTLETKDGREIQTELVGNVYTEGNRRAIQLNIRDLTERRKFERQLQHTQKLESLGLLAGGVAHDFNNLLTGILGNASLAYAETPPDNPLRPPLREIVRASERAADLTRQLLAYAGKGRFVVEPIRLSDLISEILMLVRTSIPKNVELKVDLTAGLPSIEADPAQIQQLVMNLVINGAEAIGEGKPGTVEIRTGLRELSAQDVRDNFAFEVLAPGWYVTLEIKDTGSGMDEATKAKIFDPFFTTKFTGRGLGLAAALGIVKTLRGAIRVYSVPGRGTSFHVFFPAGSAQAISRPRREPRRVRGSGTILVIDDESIVRQLARAVLERNGFEVLVAENGQVGVDLFRSNQDRIALIVLDLTMPVMGGEQAFDILRSIQFDVPVLLSSGYDEREAAMKFAGKDFAGFLQKPYDVNRLVEVVSSALGLRTEE